MIICGVWQTCPREKEKNNLASIDGMKYDLTGDLVVRVHVDFNLYIYIFDGLGK